MNIVSSNEPKRILVVDDNVDAADSLVMLLKFSGYTTAAAHTAEAGLALAQVFQPHFILLDLGLPIMGGYEVAKRIRSSPALTGVHMFAVTAYGQEDDKRRTAEAGFDAHMVKPIDLDELLTNISCRAASARVSSPNRKPAATDQCLERLD